MAFVVLISPFLPEQEEPEASSDVAQQDDVQPDESSESEPEPQEATTEFPPDGPYPDPTSEPGEEFWTTTFEASFPPGTWADQTAEGYDCKVDNEDGFMLTTDSGTLVAFGDSDQLLTFGRADSVIEGDTCVVRVATMGDFVDDLAPTYVLSDGSTLGEIQASDLYSGQRGGVDGRVDLSTDSSEVDPDQQLTRVLTEWFDPAHAALTGSQNPELCKEIIIIRNSNDGFRGWKDADRPIELMSDLGGTEIAYIKALTSCSRGDSENIAGDLGQYTTLIQRTGPPSSWS